MPNLATLLESSAAQYPERTAIVFEGTRLTYAQLERAVNQVATLLCSRGIGPGDKVAVSCPNVPGFPIVYYGILKVGATVVPLNILLKSREIGYHLQDSGAKAYFAFQGDAGMPVGEAAWEGFQAAENCTHFFPVPADPDSDEQPSTFDSVDVDDDDTAVILYTSGTTGTPKGAELRHRNLRDNAVATAEIFGVHAHRPDTFLGVLPLFHAFGQTVIQNVALAYGGMMVLQPRFEAKAALDAMQAHRVSFFAGVPTMYWGLLDALDDSVDTAALSQHLRIAVSGGSALPADIHRQVEERLDVTVLEGYGLSETSPVASFSRPGAEVRVGSIGVPIPGVKMKLVNDDWSGVSDDEDAVREIAIKGHNVFKGYLGRPEATAEVLRDGWFRSGDLARKDAEGFYYLIDRAKDVIIRGGYNVYPRELEEVLITHPGVSYVAVIGVPSESHGEEIKAVVVKRPGVHLSEVELRAWGKAQFASYKYPRIIEFRAALPMTSTGKILKRAIR